MSKTEWMEHRTVSGGRALSTVWQSGVESFQCSVRLHAPTAVTWQRYSLSQRRTGMVAHHTRPQQTLLPQVFCPPCAHFAIELIAILLRFFTHSEKLTRSAIYVDWLLVHSRCK